MSAGGNTPTYAIRLHQRALQDIQEAQERVAALSGGQMVADWHDGLMAALSTLATYPRRCLLAREGRILKRDVRQLLYPQSPSGGAAHRILFTVHEGDEEAPFVFILHIRHSARRPMTRREAQDI